jgi:hypothetical protein
MNLKTAIGFSAGYLIKVKEDKYIMEHFSLFGDLSLLSDAKTRSLCPENIHGEPGKGGMATEGSAAHRAAHLGRGWKINPFTVIEPGAVATIADVDGPGVIQSMWFANAAARQLILRMYWDGQEHPSVECPLMEFFAYSWHKTDANNLKGPFFQINSLPVAVNPNRGFNCFWPMPFFKHCRMTLENRTSRPFNCYYQINYSLTELPENASCFHAYFRRTNPVPYKEDYVIIDGIKGKGHYMGTALFVGLNGSGNWWGEGEVKFYIDDDGEFPTICGTGTEDYFGGAYDWVVDDKYVLYSGPFMGMHQLVQPDSLFQCQQRFSMYRWHIPDPVRFGKKLRVTIQDLGWAEPREKYLSRRDDFASVAYWYQALPGNPFGTFPGDDEIMFI